MKQHTTPAHGLSGTKASELYLEVGVGGAGGSNGGVVVAEEALLIASHHRCVSLTENSLGWGWGPASSLGGLLKNREKYDNAVRPSTSTSRG